MLSSPNCNIKLFVEKTCELHFKTRATSITLLLHKLIHETSAHCQRAGLKQLAGKVLFDRMWFAWLCIAGQHKWAVQSTLQIFPLVSANFQIFLKAQLSVISCLCHPEE